MFLKEITIEGYKGFKNKTTIELDKNLTVFIGANGSGKTSVLEAISCCLQMLKTSENINQKLNINTRSVVNIDSELLKLVANFHFSKQNDFSIEIEKKKGDSGFDGKFSNKSNQDFAPFLPLLIFYPVDRVLKKSEQFKIGARSGSSYLDSDLSVDSMDLAAFVEWYVNFEYERFLASKESNIVIEFDDVKSKVIEFFNRLNPGLSVSNFKGQPIRDEFNINNGFSLTVKKGDNWYGIDNLSDGEKTLFLLVADIAARRYYSKSGNANYYENKGIVLIDEIEKHLHPAWQRKAIDCLIKVFPDIQFIVTTHSPQVLSNVHNKSIRLIKDFKVFSDLNAYGRDSNSILNSLFEVDELPEHSNKVLEKFHELLEDGKYDEAKIQLDKLSEIVGENDTTYLNAYYAYEFEVTPVIDNE